MRSIVMFTKAPEPGKVKTRLTPQISDIAAAAFHEAFVLDTLDGLSSIKSVDKYIACHPDKDHIFFKGIEETFPVAAFTQVGDTLGERMENALFYLRGMGYKEILIIGSDSPTLDFKIVDDAFDRLKKKELVIGPSLDGGYYLIGISAEIPDLFGDIEWGSDSVFEETIKKVKGSGLNCSVLPFWYDIDTINELRFMQIHLDAMNDGSCVRTREMIKRLKETNGGLI